MNKRIILRGYTSPETAYVVNDYAYALRPRRKIRYWLEFKRNYGYRLVTQTANPKVAVNADGKAVEVWNKPKASTYAPGFCIMYLDEQGHPQWTRLYCYSDAGKNIADFRAEWGSQFNAGERNSVEVLEKVSRKLNPNCWSEWDAKQSAPVRSQVAHIPLGRSTRSPISQLQQPRSCGWCRGVGEG